MSGSRRKHPRLVAAAGLVPIALLLIGAKPGGDVTLSRSANRGASSGLPRIVFGAWFKKGSDTVVHSTLRAVPATVSDPFLNQAVFGSGAGSDSSVFRINEPAMQEQAAGRKPPMLDARDAMRTVQTVALYGLIWLAPMGALMVTAFVRINIVLVLLRQALGNPQVPGNQVLMALVLLLTALVMRPVGERVYTQAILPYTSGQATPAQAWAAGSTPIKTFMIDQIIQTKHQAYLWSLYRYAVPPSPGQVEPQDGHEFPFRVVAPAYLLSELTTALVMGFYLYLPFLVIDLVVSAVLAAMGLYMLPPTLVAMPMKLIVFVLADGWLLVASMLLSSFAVGGS